jgi:hypothetical protein
MQAPCEKAWPSWPFGAGHQALIDTCPAALTLDERRALAERIQVSACERVVPYAPFGEWFAPVAHSPKLWGAIEMPGTMILWNIEKAPQGKAGGGGTAPRPPNLWGRASAFGAVSRRGIGRVPLWLHVVSHAPLIGRAAHPCGGSRRP